MSFFSFYDMNNANQIQHSAKALSIRDAHSSSMMTSGSMTTKFVRRVEITKRGYTGLGCGALHSLEAGHGEQRNDRRYTRRETSVKDLFLSRLKEF